MIQRKQHASALANGTAAVVRKRQLKPRWVAGRHGVDVRTLWLGKLLVKQFTGPADIQELILAAFQELRWPKQIDDPIPPGASRQDPKDRLRDAVRNLNGTQKDGRIRFRTCANGTAIRWEII